MSETTETSPICERCAQLSSLCFCDAPRTKNLYEKRLQWANFDHPASDDPDKQIARMMAEPMKWMEFAKLLEREIFEREQRDFDHMVERNLRDD